MEPIPLYLPCTSQAISFMLATWSYLASDELDISWALRVTVSSAVLGASLVLGKPRLPAFGWHDPPLEHCCHAMDGWFSMVLAPTPGPRAPRRAAARRRALRAILRCWRLRRDSEERENFRRKQLH